VSGELIMEEANVHLQISQSITPEIPTSKSYGRHCVFFAKKAIQSLNPI
jgi:hypothetical protein